MPNRSFRKPLYWIFPALLTACAATGPQQESPSSAVSAEEEVVNAAEGALSSDIVYNILIGEIALQRRQLDLAYEHQLQGALLANDALAAERAARIAIHQKDHAKAMEAVESWVELAPEDFQARVMAVTVSMWMQQKEAALEHLRKVVTLSEEKGEDGFLHAVAAVTQARQSAMALELLQQLATEHPDNPQAHYGVALVAVVAKDYGVAEREARRVVRMSPDMAKAQVLLARVLMAQQQREKAKNVLRKAVDRFPQHKALNIAYGRLLVELEEVEPAYAQFKRLRRLLPEAPEIPLTLGVLAIQLDRLDEARAYLLELNGEKKGGDEAAFYLGRIDEQEKRLDKAVDWYQKVTTDKRLRLDAQVRIARILAGQGEVAKAQEKLAALRREMPDRSADIYLLEGGILGDVASPEMVMGHYDQALKMHPDRNDLLYARGLYASTHGRLHSAEQDLRKIIQQDENHADALNALGYTLADQTDRYQEALDYIERALTLKPESPAILDSMGWVQFKLGDNEQALDYLRRAYEQFPDGEIAAHLGEVLWVSGSKEEARKIWREALERDPENQYLLRAVERLDKQ
jgi:tetratricopeptide (TPR) repeat protein